MVKLAACAVAPHATIPVQANCFSHLGVGWGGGIVLVTRVHLSGCVEVRVQQECTRCASLKAMLVLLPPVDGVIVEHLLPLIRLYEAGHLNQVVDVIQCLLRCQGLIENHFAEDTEGPLHIMSDVYLFIGAGFCFGDLHFHTTYHNGIPVCRIRLCICYIIANELQFFCRAWACPETKGVSSDLTCDKILPGCLEWGKTV